MSLPRVCFELRHAHEQCVDCALQGCILLGESLHPIHGLLQLGILLRELLHLSPLDGS